MTIKHIGSSCSLHVLYIVYPLKILVAVNEVTMVSPCIVSQKLILSLTGTATPMASCWQKSKQASF